MPDASPELDAPAILRALTARGVDFVVIGGIAAVLHGAPRNTFDLDVTFAVDTANLAALGDVLMTLGGRLRGAPPGVPFVPDARTLKGVEVLTLATDLGSLDVLARPSGAPSFDVMRRNADRYDIGGTTVRVASIPDLIAMKRAAGRPKDLADIAELEAILRLRDQA